MCGQRMGGISGYSGWKLSTVSRCSGARELVGNLWVPLLAMFHLGALALRMTEVRRVSSRQARSSRGHTCLSTRPCPTRRTFGASRGTGFSRRSAAVLAWRRRKPAKAEPRARWHEEPQAAAAEYDQRTFGDDWLPIGDHGGSCKNG